MVNLEKLSKDTLIDLIREFDGYVLDASARGTIPVGVESFYINEYQQILNERAEREAIQEKIQNAPVGTFEYGGYHFTPYRPFYKGETDKQLAHDSRPWKMDAQYEMRNMRKDFELGLSRYTWQKAEYDYTDFYGASGGSICDIFNCIENGKLYVPGENELFQYTEPSNKEKAEFAIKNARASYEEPNAKKPISVFILSSAEYDGKNHGIWLSLPTDAAELRKKLSKIEAYDGQFVMLAVKGQDESLALEELLPTAASLDELNMLADFLKNMEAWQLNKLDAILQSGISGVNNAAGLINILHEDNFTGFDVLDVYSYESLGRYRETVDGDGIPEGMDYADYGRQCEVDEKGKLTDYGYVYQRFYTEPLYAEIVPYVYRLVDAALAGGIAPSKKSVLDALDEGKEKVAKADAARTGHGDKPTPRKRRGQEQGD